MHNELIPDPLGAFCGCPPCTGECEQGRRCPARRQERASARRWAWAGVFSVFAAYVLLWAAWKVAAWLLELAGSALS